MVVLVSGGIGAIYFALPSDCFSEGDSLISPTPNYISSLSEQEEEEWFVVSPSSELVI